MQLDPTDLEFQAGTLLHKRFEVVARVLPRTCAAVGGGAEAEFRRYGRVEWPTGMMWSADDAWGFCAHLLRVRPETVCRLEHHRASFVRSRRRWMIRFVQALPFRGGFRPGLHVLVRFPSARWHEWVLYAGS